MTRNRTDKPKRIFLFVYPCGSASSAPSVFRLFKELAEQTELTLAGGLGAK